MKKVLIMEDELNIRSFVVINLKRAGYDVIEAGDGQEALDAIAANPDAGVAILDIMVPGDMDGFEVCRRIRATNKQMGIIMLTARTHRGQCRRQDGYHHLYHCFPSLSFHSIHFLNFSFSQFLNLKSCPRGQTL